MATSKSTVSSTPAKKARTASAAQPSQKSGKAKLISTGITPDERSQMIAEAAYYRAEKRGFNPDGQVDDWLQAEVMIDEILGQPHEAERAQRH